LLDNNPISTTQLEIYYGVDGKRLQQQYKKNISDYSSWNQKKHAQEYVLQSHNIGPYLALDETALSNGELYTILSNKNARGKKGSLVAIIKGTQADKVIEVLEKIPKKQRDQVEEITVDMAGSMNLIARKSFGKASIITDRFHVQKLAFEAVQEIRIKHRWEEIDKENTQYQEAKKKKKAFKPTILTNGDSPKQLLARSRYLLFKSPNKWTDSQKIRAEVLFKEYPDIKKAYYLSNSLSSIYNQKITKGIALTKMAQWFNEAENSGFKTFATIRRTFEQHYRTILNYFENRSTNAFAESFNAKIKDFRRNFRGVRDIDFFLFRLAKIFG
jgi:transposase